MPSNVEPPPKTRGLTAIAGAMSLIAVLLIVQIWLLSAALESFLAGKRDSALPAAIFSGVMFLVCLGLYLFVDRVDSNVRDSSEER
jgi:predicted Co/Zn/Cd cation transporter (cation efflux family)